MRPRVSNITDSFEHTVKVLNPKSLSKFMIYFRKSWQYGQNQWYLIESRDSLMKINDLRRRLGVWTCCLRGGSENSIDPPIPWYPHASGGHGYGILTEWLVFFWSGLRTPCGVTFSLPDPPNSTRWGSPWICGFLYGNEFPSRIIHMLKDLAIIPNKIRASPIHWHDQPATSL